MKKWKKILSVTVMLALVFCAGRGSAVLVNSWQNGGLLGGKCFGISHRELGTWIR